jgi:DNA-binding NtrC family response regulator
MSDKLGAQSLDRRVLVVDDDVDLAESLQEIFFMSRGIPRIAHNIVGATSAASALNPHVAIDRRQPRAGEWPHPDHDAERRVPGILCVVITARGEVEHAVEALGAAPSTIS